MIEEIVANLLQNSDIKWTVTSPDDGKPVSITPGVEDVNRILEELATHMIPINNGDSIAVGGIMMEKKSGGNAVYVYVGDYI